METQDILILGYGLLNLGLGVWIGRSGISGVVSSLVHDVENLKETVFPPKVTASPVVVTPPVVVASVHTA